MATDEPSSGIEEIERALQDLTLHSGNIGKASNAVSILATSSRLDKSTRRKLANPQVLKVLVEGLECSLNDSLETVDLALRCIGNACIDNNAAREKITKLGFSWAKQCLPRLNSSDKGRLISQELVDINTSTLAAKVLYNICSDYEPAQQQCFREHVHYFLIALCNSLKVAKSEDFQLYLELLFWMCGHNLQEEDPLPPAELSTLLELHLCLDEQRPEDFAMLLETCLSFLRVASVQSAVIERDLVERVWYLLELNEYKIIMPCSNRDDLGIPEIFVPLSTSLVWVLSDIAANQEFHMVYGYSSSFIQNHVIPNILIVEDGNESGYCSRLVTAGCQMLGNLLWSAQDLDIAVDLVNRRALHKPLLALVKASQDTELVHSAARLLVQLSRYHEASEVVGSDELARESLKRLCNHEMAELKKDGIALLRTLGKSSPANQTRFAGLAEKITASPIPSDSAMVDAIEEDAPSQS